MEKYKYDTSLEDGEINIREEIEKYLKHWKWFVLGVFIALIIATLYLRYEFPSYKATASIKVKDETKGGIASELAAFSDLNMLSNVKNNVDNEVVVLQSKTLIGKTILDLGLNYDYIVQAKIRSTPVYENSPIKARFLDSTKNFLEKDTIFYIKKINNKKFELLNKNEESAGLYLFNSPIKTKLGKLIIDLKKINNNDFTVAVKLTSLKKAINNYQKKLTVEPYSKTTSIINLSFVDISKKRAENFLNILILNYQKEALNDTNEISKNTASFINNRLNIINEELDGVEKETESFKKSNKITDLSSEAEIYLKNVSSVEKELVNSEMELKVVNMMSDVLRTNSSSDLIPANILPDNGSANTLIGEYNKLLLERKRIASGVTSNNNTLIKLDQQIETIRSTIRESVSNLKKSVDLKTKNLSKQTDVLSGKINQIPTQERQFRILARQQQIKEGLYLYLLQKREEAEISLNVTSTNSKFVDKGLTDDIPVSPKKPIIYLAALLLGLLIPFIIIYIQDLLDVKIKTPNEIKKLFSGAYLGEVPKAKETNELILNNSRSEFSEALRIIKTNINFMLFTKKSDKAKVVFVTSTVPKEGKTYMSVNIATIFSFTKKTLLIGLDVRNPQLDKYFNLPTKGITNYLSSEDTDISKYIIKSKENANLHILPTGIIPPNPTELLTSDKLTELFSILKLEYDIIIVDTAPISPVTDTLAIANLSDLFVYVVKSNFLDKRMLMQTELLYRDKKIKNMSIILNYYNNMSKYGYGYGYGYGVNSKKTWYKFW